MSPAARRCEAWRLTTRALSPRTLTVAVLAACVCALACVGGASGLTGDDSSPPAEEDAAAPIGGAGGSPPASRPDAAPLVDRPAEPAPDTEAPPDATPDRPTLRPDSPPPSHGSPFATWWDHPVSGGPTWSGPMVAGQVAVTPGKPVGWLSPGFVGFSFEKTHLRGSLEERPGAFAPASAMPESRSGFTVGPLRARGRPKSWLRTPKPRLARGSLGGCSRKKPWVARWTTAGGRRP